MTAPQRASIAGVTSVEFVQKWRGSVSAGFAVLALGISACAAEAPQPVSTAPATAFTRGPVPESARKADGSIDLSQVPDFIPAAGENGNVGWIWSADVLPPPGEAAVEIVTVYADDLVTPVGRMYPDVGFVPLGAEDEMLPDPHQDREVTIHVRNESEVEAVLVVTEARDVPNWSPARIVTPIVVAAGADEDVVIRAPLDRWSLNMLGDLGFFYSDDLGRRSRDGGVTLVVGEDRVLQMPSDR